MYLKFICWCWLTAYIFAAPPTDEVPSERQQPTVVPIISLSAEYEPNGKFKYSYETGNGIKRQETAYDKELPEGKHHSDCSNEGGEDDDSDEIHVQKGSYSYTAPDGTVVSVRYIADENGFQPIISEVSRTGQQLSGEPSQKLDQSPTSSMRTKQIDQNNNETKPLKFGDKLKKNGKPTKVNVKSLQQNSLPIKEQNEGDENPTMNKLNSDELKNKGKTVPKENEKQKSANESNMPKEENKIMNRILPEMANNSIMTPNANEDTSSETDREPVTLETPSNKKKLDSKDQLNENHKNEPPNSDTKTPKVEEKPTDDKSIEAANNTQDKPNRQSKVVQTNDTMPSEETKEPNQEEHGSVNQPDLPKEKTKTATNIPEKSPPEVNGSPNENVNKSTGTNETMPYELKDKPNEPEKSPPEVNGSPNENVNKSTGTNETMPYELKDKPNENKSDLPKEKNETVSNITEKPSLGRAESLNNNANESIGNNETMPSAETKNPNQEKRGSVNQSDLSKEKNETASNIPEKTLHKGTGPPKNNTNKTIGDNKIMPSEETKNPNQEEHGTVNPSELLKEKTEAVSNIPEKLLPEVTKSPNGNAVKTIGTNETMPSEVKEMPDQKKNGSVNKSDLPEETNKTANSIPEKSPPEKMESLNNNANKSIGTNKTVPPEEIKKQNQKEHGSLKQLDLPKEKNGTMSNPEKLLPGETKPINNNGNKTVGTNETMPSEETKKPIQEEDGSVNQSKTPEENNETENNIAEKLPPAVTESPNENISEPIGTNKTMPSEVKEKLNQKEPSSVNKLDLPKDKNETVSNLTEKSSPKGAEGPNENVNKTLETNNTIPSEEKEPLTSPTTHDENKNESGNKNKLPDNEEMKLKTRENNPNTTSEKSPKPNNTSINGKNPVNENKNLVNGTDNPNNMTNNQPEDHKNSNNNDSNGEIIPPDKEKVANIEKSNENEKSPDVAPEANRLDEDEISPNRTKLENKNEDNTSNKNGTLQNDNNIPKGPEKSRMLSEPSNQNKTRDIVKEVQKSVKEAEKHEKNAENAAREAVKSAEVAENAAEVAQNAAKETEQAAKRIAQSGKESRQSAIDAAKKHAKQAVEAAKEATQAAEKADIAAEDAKNAAKEAEKIVQMVQSSSNTQDINKLIDKAGNAVKDASKSSEDAVNAAKDAMKHTKTLTDGDQTSVSQNPRNNTELPGDITTQSPTTTDQS